MTWPALGTGTSGPMRDGSDMGHGSSEQEARSTCRSIWHMHHAGEGEARGEGHSGPQSVWFQGNDLL
jgi:hypothetical protein